MFLVLVSGLDGKRITHHVSLFLVNSFGTFDFHRDSFKVFFVSNKFSRQFYIISPQFSPCIWWKCFECLRKTHWDGWYGIVLVPFSRFSISECSSINKLLHNLFNIWIKFKKVKVKINNYFCFQFSKQIT